MDRCRSISLFELVIHREPSTTHCAAVLCCFFYRHTSAPTAISSHYISHHSAPAQQYSCDSPRLQWRISDTAARIQRSGRKKKEKEKRNLTSARPLTLSGILDFQFPHFRRPRREEIRENRERKWKVGGGTERALARCTIVQSAVMRSHVICPSVCDVGGSGPHRWKIFETNCANN